MELRTAISAFVSGPVTVMGSVNKPPTRLESEPNRNLRADGQEDG